MAKAKMFVRAHGALMRDAEAAVRIVRAKLDLDLEELAVNTFGAPSAADNTLMAPPSVPVRVHCWHCDEKYDSGDMRLEYRPRYQAALVEMLGGGEDRLDPLWWCKNSDCDGAGFGHDIHAVKTRKRSSKAEGRS